MKKTLCAKLSLKENEQRFFLNGERLNNESTLSELDIESGETIEVFDKCYGGGPRTRRHKSDFFSDREIESALNESKEDCQI